MLTAAAAFTLTAAGVAVAGLTAYRRRYLAATRWFAVALLPAGLYLTGLFPVARTIGGEIADWATQLVFDPRVWIGIALLALSTGLLLGSRGVARRRLKASATASGAPAAAGVAPARPAVTGARPPVGGTAKAPGRPGTAASADDGLGDFADIEEILRKRGI
ncbi:hypothetical protein OG689_08090 [Kitasatospora sp. NBC_00240]|uniref:hypothetical protein n=1 Tax=Kitasatospora sp. NBC_00240 TaxID=2903567 RepID=UPI00224F8DD2|nr:hypothetical protein [Kitasatospora sp. NBC_00240]MCX5209246.1 hypothetical protein [Kitasatospora sp. NBC_00240]